MILVSRSEQSSFVISSAYWADNEESGGVGSMEAFKLAASSRRVSFISSLSLSKGIARTWAILSFSSFKDGMVWFSRTRESSKFVGICTFSRADSEGIVISGMEKSELNRFWLLVLDVGIDEEGLTFTRSRVDLMNRLLEAISVWILSRIALSEVVTPSVIYSSARHSIRG
jgi:hypothetical protein